ncbi:MAG: class I SAM-dependent methyltransferase [Alphaproteobacteria bacterium]|nr:class I SAM-dependent methyltransferase [Alphaproteobacteria bacterium]
MTDSWLGFWNRPHSIYVNERHLRVHCRRVADDILSVLPGEPGLRVLDYGCGDALDADRIAARVGRLFLYDAAPAVQARLRKRFARVPNITVLDDAGLAALGEAALDVIVVFSVIQYLPRSELPALARDWRRRLRPGGRLIVADIIPPEVGMMADIRSLLATASAHGFLLAALAGLVATFFSDYRQLRQRLGFAVYSETEIAALLNAAGFAPALQARNLGFHPARRTVIARAV